MWMTNELLPKIWVFWANLNETQSWRGHMWSFCEISPFSWSKQHVHQVIPNQSNQVVHNPHIVQAKRKRIRPIQNGDYMWKILAPKFHFAFEQHMGTASQNKQCQPIKKILHFWNMRHLYVILAHMVVGTTLHQ